jgi:hypothetical protein
LPSPGTTENAFDVADDYDTKSTELCRPPQSLSENDIDMRGHAVAIAVEAGHAKRHWGSCGGGSFLQRLHL